MTDDASVVYRIKVTLRSIRPPVWRRLEVRGDTSLYKLHQILQEAFGWWNSHLHEFVVAGESYGESFPDADFHVRSARRLKLAQAAPKVGDRFLYEYDFGDGWRHEIKVETIEPPEAGVRYPRCTHGKRRAPPEDVGGPPGYQHFLEALADPDHDEHEEYLEWVGGSFDPNAFDLEEINAKLRRIR